MAVSGAPWPALVFMAATTKPASEMILTAPSRLLPATSGTSGPRSSSEPPAAPVTPLASLVLFPRGVSLGPMIAFRPPGGLFAVSVTLGTEDSSLRALIRANATHARHPTSSSAARL